MNFIRRIIMSPWTEFGIGVAMFFAGVTEIVSEFQHVENPEIGGHHGVSLLGIFMALRALAEALEGARKMQEGLGNEHEA